MQEASVVPQVVEPTPKKTRTKKPSSATLSIAFGGVELPVWSGNQKHPLIPQLSADIWYEPEHMKAIATAVKENIACLLVGETGTGKTSILRQLAFERKQPYVRINLTGYTSPDELIGSKSAQNGSTYFEEGVLVQAMRDGALLVMDEINATPPDCLFALHSLLDDERKITLPTGTVIHPHPEFRFFATMNPDYEGTKSVNKALTDRFGIILDIQPLNPDKEKDYLIKHGIDAGHANTMVMFALKARKSYIERQTTMFVSTRTLLQWSSLVQKGLSLDEAFTVSVLNKLPSDADMRRAMSDIYNSVLKRNPQKTVDEFDIYKKSDVETLKGLVKRQKDELTQKENLFDIQKADLIAKNQVLAQAIIDERNKTKQIHALLPQLKNLMAIAEPQPGERVIPSVDAGVVELTPIESPIAEAMQKAKEESPFANTHLDMRKTGTNAS